MVAMLLASLAPSLSLALGAAAKGASLVEVCTVQGAKWVQVADGDSQPAPSSGHLLLDHCPYCSLQAPTLGLPPAAATAPLATGWFHELPRAFLAAPRTLHAWVRAQPRAPPSFS